MTGDGEKRVGSLPNITGQSNLQIDDVPYVVFLDTQVYYTLSFNWTSSLLISLKERFVRGSIRLVSTEIVKHEIRKGIEKRYDVFRRAVQKAEKASLVIRCLGDKRVAGLADLLEDGPSLQKVTQGAWDFLTETQT